MNHLKNKMNPQLDEILTRIYHDPATGFRPAEGFYNLLPSRLKARVSLDELTAWVDKQEVRQQFRRPTIRYTHISSHSCTNHRLSAD